MKIFNFFDFIFEKYKPILVPFQFSTDFENVIKQIDSPISNDLIDMRLQPSEISLVNIGLSNDDATFITSTKLSQHFSTEDDRILSTLIKPLTRVTEIYFKNKTDIKIGRLVRKLFGNKFTDQQIEKFVNQYKSILDSKSLNFVILSGYSIIQAYTSDYYTQDAPKVNPLYNSCMNDQSHLIEFYNYVPVRLLTLCNSENDIFGRALLWNTDKGVFMDRVYVANDQDYFKFIDYAKKNNFIYKWENKSGDKILYVKGGTTTWFPMKVKLNFNISEYNLCEWDRVPKDIPYMDTFVFGHQNYLQNYEPSGDRYYILTQTEGEVIEIVVQYDIYGQRIEQDQSQNYEWSVTQDGWIHTSQCQWIECMNDYLSFDYLKDPKNGFVLQDGKWIKIKN
jgi:hypothetical protein